MILEAYSLEDALKEAEIKFGYNRKQVRAFTLKPPYRKFFGLIRRPGEYRIQLMEPEEKIENKNLDCIDRKGSVEIVSAL
jgi:hypothetical protein